MGFFSLLVIRRLYQTPHHHHHPHSPLPPQIWLLPVCCDGYLSLSWSKETEEWPLLLPKHLSLPHSDLPITGDSETLCTKALSRFFRRCKSQIALLIFATGLHGCFKSAWANPVDVFVRFDTTPQNIAGSVGLCEVRREGFDCLLRLSIIFLAPSYLVWIMGATFS